MPGVEDRPDQTFLLQSECSADGLPRAGSARHHKICVPLRQGYKVPFITSERGAGFRQTDLLTLALPSIISCFQVWPISVISTWVQPPRRFPVSRIKLQGWYLSIAMSRLLLPCPTCRMYKKRRKLSEKYELFVQEAASRGIKEVYFNKDLLELYHGRRDAALLRLVVLILPLLNILTIMFTLLRLVALILSLLNILIYIQGGSPS